MLVIVAPGQGAQTPGFLTPWLEDPDLRRRFDWLSTVAGLDLAHYGTQADAETIRDTKIAQPLLVATGLIAALDLFPHPTDAFARIGAVAGHSVGELTAAAGARVITAEQAMVLVRERGNAMAEAAARTATGMTAVLGGDREEVLAAIEQARPHRRQRQRPRPGRRRRHDGAARRLRRGPAGQGAADAAQRRRRLPHRHMEPAVGRLALAGPVGLHARPAHRASISNRDGQVVHDGREVLRRMVGQIANPVRWDLCMETMSDLGVTGILEMPPAGTLTGIAKRALKGVETFALKTPDQLDDARAFCDKHGEASMIETTPTWRMVVSPPRARSTCSSEAVERDVLEPGAVIGDGGQPARPHRHHRAARRLRSSSGSSRTATSSPPASRCCACTRRGAALMAAITAGTGAPHAAIMGVGAYRPVRLVPNSEVVDAIDSSDEWIQQRSGHQDRAAGPVPRSRSR